MKDIAGLPGATLSFEEGEYYALVTAHLDGESYSIRVPLGDGRYFATRVWEVIVAPALGSTPLERWKASHGEAVAPVDFSEV